MKKTIFAFLLLFLAFLHAAPQKVERFLLVAGANNGGVDRVKLRYAQSDANSFAGVMSQMGGVNRNNILRVFDPSAASMQNGFAELEKRLKSKNSGVRKEVIVYYSGHADEKGLRLGTDVYSWAEFRKNVNNINADIKVAILDACGSGAITRTKGGVSKPAFLQDASTEMKGYAFLTSSNENEASQESDRIKGSFFTHALVGGLRGAADMTGNGKVTLNEAYQYAFDETLKNTQNTSAGSQHPSRDMNLAGTGDIVMTDLRETNAVLTLDSNLEGRIFIRDEQGNLFTELNKIRGRQIELGMPAGKYSVQMEAPSKIWMANEIKISEGKKNTLSIKDMQNIERESAVARGNADSAMSSLDSPRKVSFRVNPFGYSSEPVKELQLGFITLSKNALVGTQISIFGNFAMGDMAGTQLSAIGNVATGNIYGFQGAGVFNVANNFTGVQSAPFNIAKKGKGVQAATVNLYADSLIGFQAAVVNIARVVTGGQAGAVNLAMNAGNFQAGAVNITGGVDKFQTGAVNIAGNSGKFQAGAVNITGSASEFQTGAVNITGSVDKFQTGAVNIAGSAGKVQVGAVNIGGHVGRQIGAVNIAAKSDNTPIGLINIIGNGIIDATFYADETSRAGATLHLGTPYLYTLFEYASEFTLSGSWSNTFPVSWGYGLGTRFGMLGNFFSLDYAYLNTYNENPGNFNLGPGGSEKDNDNKLQKIRFGASYKLLPGLALSSGLTLNALSRHNGSDFYLEPSGEYHWHWTFFEHKVRLWPGLYAGLTVGKF